MRFCLSNISDMSYDEVGTHYLFAPTSSATQLALANNLGLELTELSLAAALGENREPALRSFMHNAEAIKAAHLPLTVHAPFNELYCHSVEPRVVRLAFDILSEVYRFADSVHASVMVVHVNHCSAICHPEWMVAHQILFWRDFLSRNAGNTAITLENTIDETPDQLLRIAREVNDPRLGICLDMGHANLSGMPVERWIRTLAPCILHYHIHNNSGIRSHAFWTENDTHNAINDGSLDMERMLRLASCLTPSATATLETSRLTDSIAWLRQKHFV